MGVFVGVGLIFFDIFKGSAKVKKLKGVGETKNLGIDHDKASPR